MICTYNANAASIIGVNAATIFEYIMYFVYQSKCQRENFFSGKYWTQETKEALSKQFFFMSEKEITMSLATLLYEKFLERADDANGLSWYSIGKNGERFYIETYT